MEIISLSVLLPVVCLFAVRKLIKFGGLSTDRPNERSSHLEETPRGAGVVLIISIVVGYCFAWFSGFHASAEVFGLILLTILCGLLGTVEDIWEISPKARFVGEAVLAVFLIRSGLAWKTLPFIGGEVTLSYYQSFFLTLLWVVWGINFYNFMDGINGIALMQGAALSLFYSAMMYFSGASFLACVIFSLLVAILSILPFNYPKARIFLGDSGSLLLGFFFAVLPLALHGQRPEFSIFHASLVILPFIGDSGLTILRRLISRENIVRPHRTHCYQIMTPDKTRHAKVSLAYGLVAFIEGSLIFLYFYYNEPIWFVISIAIAFLVVVKFMIMQIRYFKQSVSSGR
ncbi:MAG: hypothetical protein HQK54_06530 [Oligoflexales bacterium]|nr:hypothetical protein [Oligoflexales bacterium]